MSYFATITFDLKNASSDDYQTAYTELGKIGFYTTIRSESGNQITLPTTTCAGTFTGQTAAGVRDALTARVEAAFQRNGFVSEIFVNVGRDWAWAYRRTKAPAMRTLLGAY